MAEVLVYVVLDTRLNVKKQVKRSQRLY